MTLLWILVAALWIVAGWSVLRARRAARRLALLRRITLL